VFGEGKRGARVVFVGEQPGDQEDRAGRPFVGPAGRVLDDALEAAGIDRSAVYVTNAVKHFKWRAAGKRRLHERPVRPQFVVCLGATAAQALISPTFKVTKERSKLIDSPLASRVIATVHPSSILRAPDEKARNEEMRRFVADLRAVAKVMRAL
jgi:uracil-DNA glycosylase family 4